MSRCPNRLWCHLAPIAGPTAQRLLCPTVDGPGGERARPEGGRSGDATATERAKALAVAGGAVLAIVAALILRSALADDPSDDAEASVLTAEPSPPSTNAESGAPQASASADSTDSSDLVSADDCGSDRSTGTSAPATSSTSEGDASVRFVEVSDITMTRTGPCPEVTVATDVIIQVTVDGDTTTHQFPDRGVADGVVVEGSDLPISQAVSRSAGDQWTV